MVWSDLGKRSAVALVCIPIVFLIVLIGHVPFLIFVNIVLAMALWEFYLLAEKKGFFPSKIPGIAATLVISWGLYFNYEKEMGSVLLLVFMVVLIFELFKRKMHALVNASVTIFGVLYISLFSSFILIREIPLIVDRPYLTGGWLIMLIFLSIWICDTGAYVLGSTIGKQSLYKRISPKKTWEGAIGGFLIGIGAAIGFNMLFTLRLLLVDSIVIGIIVGTVGQLSDLIESMFKRDAGVKDSSSFLPGHGGILDRFDSPLLVGPSIYLYLMVRGFPI
ncbi:phosphatidate cytidylyltransferase [bacterium]|nr:phosphatidate cytidylyltransferase [bacterium]